jgi:hypothetical protein
VDGVAAKHPVKEFTFHGFHLWLLSRASKCRTAVAGHEKPVNLTFRVAQCRFNGVVPENPVTILASAGGDFGG